MRSIKEKIYSYLYHIMSDVAHREIKGELSRNTVEIIQNREHIERINTTLVTESEAKVSKLINTINVLERQLQKVQNNLDSIGGDIDGLSEDIDRIEKHTMENQTAIHIMDHRIDSSYWAFRDWKIRTMALPALSFEVHLTEHCNLNCIGCDHFSPLAEKKFTDINSFRRDFERLADLFDGEAGSIHLLGGEPLLHPQAAQFCKVARKNFPEANIDIVTNGLLLPQMAPDFWQVLRSEKIKISVTKYPIALDYGNIASLAGDYEVGLSFFNDTGEDKTMTHNKYDLEGTQDPRESFIDCCRANKCIFLSEGKLYPCTFPGNIHHFNKFFSTSMQTTDRDFIDIYKAASTGEILSFLSAPIPFCRYCDIRHAENGVKWEVSGKKIEEWI